MSMAMARVIIMVMTMTMTKPMALATAMAIAYYTGDVPGSGPHFQVPALAPSTPHRCVPRYAQLRRAHDLITTMLCAHPLVCSLLKDPYGNAQNENPLTPTSSRVPHPKTRSSPVTLDPQWGEQA